MHNRPKVSFIIVCWNNQVLMQECLESVQAQTYSNYEVIVVDNGSTDDSVATIKKIMPTAKVIEAGRNLGFAAGNNLGIVEALKDEAVGYISLLNTDARISSDWLEKIVTFAGGKPRAACLQGTTFDYYNHDVIDSTHIFIAHNGQGTQGSWRHVYEADMGPCKIFGCNAAACVVTRNFIEAQPFSQLFDETMFMYLEDVDLAVRATVMNWDNYLVPGAQAYHMGSASSGKNPGFSLYLTFRNNSALLYKNLPFLMICRILPKLIKGDYDTVKTLKRRGDDAAAKKVIKGRLVGLTRLPLFTLKRARMTRARKIPKAYLWELMRKGF